MKAVFIFFLSLCFSFGLDAQDFKKDMLALHEKMLHAKNMSYTLHYNLFLDNDFKAAYQQRDIKIIKSFPLKLVCSDGNSEVIYNKDARLMVNHKQKRIIASPPQKGTAINNDEILGFLDTKFDTLMLMYEKVDAKIISKNLVDYTCYFKQGIYLSMIIRFNTETKLPEKITYYHKFPIKKNDRDEKMHPVVLEVTYKKFEFSPKLEPETFSQKKYIQKKQDRYVTTPAYSSYTFINLFENNYEIED